MYYLYVMHGLSVWSARVVPGYGYDEPMGERRLFIGHQYGPVAVGDL